MSPPSGDAPAGIPEPSRRTSCSVDTALAELLAEAIDPEAALPPGIVTACRPVVAGLLSLLDDPDLAIEAGTPRHAWIELDLVRPVPLDVPLEVTAALTRRAAIGRGTGLWITVDVDGPGGGLVRSRHVVAARRGVPPGPQAPLPRPSDLPMADGPESDTELGIDAARVDAYRIGAADISPVHRDEAAIAPGLMLLLAAVAASGGLPGPPPWRAGARFVRPLSVGQPARVRSRSGAGSRRALRIESGDRAVVRHGHVGPAPPGGHHSDGVRQ
ncbi:MAG: hypothetical protein ACR2JF_17435 [Iamia sp.]